MSKEEKIDWVDKTVKLSEITEFEKNVRDYSLEDLSKMKESIKKFGVIEPLVLNKDLKIINGHLRYNALLELNEKEVTCTVAKQELSDDEHLELYLRLNRNIAGVNDYSKLREHFTSEELIDGGFSEWEVQDIQIDPNDIEAEEKPPVFPYDLVFETPEDKEVAQELLSRLNDTHAAEESVEGNLISFIKSKKDGKTKS